MTGSYLASGVVGLGGYAYSFSDATSSPPGGSSACVNSTALCGAGFSAETIIATPGDPYGGAIGVNLNQAKGDNTPTGTINATGVGLSYAVVSSNLEYLRVMIDSDGVDYCANLSELTGTVSWASFNTLCYDEPPDGDSLTGPPVGASHIEFEVPSVYGESQTWNFCVTQLSFAP